MYAFCLYAVAAFMADSLIVNFFFLTRNIIRILDRINIRIFLPPWVHTFGINVLIQSTHSIFMVYSANIVDHRSINIQEFEIWLYDSRSALLQRSRFSRSNARYACKNNQNRCNRGVAVVSKRLAGVLKCFCWNYVERRRGDKYPTTKAETPSD